MTSPNPELLSIDDLHFGYEEDRPILRGLSAHLEPGKLTVLLGPNAAGKTTLMRLMLGQLSPSSGRIMLEGRQVDAWHPQRRATVMSYVPQRAGVSFAFTVDQVVAMGRYAQAPAPQVIEEVLAACDLAGLRRRVFHQLSFGQQQRVLLARAMAQAHDRGRIMLLDEPGSAMDLWHVHQMMQRLTGLARQGMAVLIVLHDLNLAARYADLVWLMHEGRLIAADAWQEVLRPEILEPIYRVRLTPLTVGRPGSTEVGPPRPVFIVEPTDTLSGVA